MTELEQNLTNILNDAIQYTKDQKALVIYDLDSELTRLLSDAYKKVLPDAEMINFTQTTPDDVLKRIDSLSEKDLVVLVQSTSFHLHTFRFRLELFKRNLAVIEHPHLGRMPSDQIATYIDALAYDQNYYRGLGGRLRERIDKAQRIVLESGGEELVYETPMEPAKLNVGDYRELKNTGGQFPIGEVFTEPVDFQKVNGVVKLFAYADENFHVQFSPEPITVSIENSIIVDVLNAPKGFKDVLNRVAADERLLIRELGFGMNRAMTPMRTVNDIGAYERMCGIHISIGHKHTMYTKAGLPKRSSKYHVDVFVDIERVLIDGEVVYQEGSYVI